MTYTDVKIGRRRRRVSGDEVVGQPLVVSYGLGVDSTAMLIRLWQQGVRPDLILFADTGGEKPETYAFLETFNGWLRSVGFPEVTVVSKKTHSNRSKHGTLEHNCRDNETLPSLAFGYKSCSLKWKVTPMDAYVSRWTPAVKAWARGMKVLRCIGYDGSPADLRRAKIKEDDKFTYWYPLRDAGIIRPTCKKMIESVGLPIPPKSACFFCPAMKKVEVAALAQEHPDLFKRGLDMEDGARDGQHGLKSTKGLGRSWSWREFAETEMPEMLARMDGEDLSRYAFTCPMDEEASKTAQDMFAVDALPQGAVLV